MTVSPLAADPYVPYSRTAPQTDDVPTLRAELQRVRDLYGRGSSQGLEAFQRLSVAAAKAGQPLSALRRHSRVESERFFALTIPGPDGHVYWDGKATFRRNDGVTRTPPRWWWEHVHGPIPSNLHRLTFTCGDKKCINVEHAVCDYFRPELYTDEQLLGALQVYAMQKGHPPTSKEWEREKRRPSSSTFSNRFGSWEAAMRAAGFPGYVSKVRSTNPETCVKAILFVRDRLGRWPNSQEFVAEAEALHAAGLPTSLATIRDHLGKWSVAVAKAGKP